MEGLTFKRSDSYYNTSPDEQSAQVWRIVREEPDSPGVLRVLREFLRVFRLIHFVGGFLLHEVREWSVLECRTVRGGADGPWAHRGRSIIEGAILEVWERFQTVRCSSRTVCRTHADGPPGGRGQSAW
jgi:hypothetical protein